MRAAVAWSLAAVIAAARAVPAQQPPGPPVAPEVRVDLITGNAAAIQIGAGVQIPVGYYGRIGLDAGFGTRLQAQPLSTHQQLDGRLDLLARFLLDPFRQAAYGLSLGGGISLRAEHGEVLRPLLLVALDVEGRRSRKGVAPAVQLGLGGGVRIGLVLRRAAVAAR